MVSRRSVTWMFAACVALTSCGNFVSDILTPADQTQGTPVPVISTSVATEAPQSVASPTNVPDYVDQVRNARYQLGLPDSLQIVQLVDGKFEQGAPGGADFISVSVTDFVAQGDLNGDDKDEIAALVFENYGGTGTFVFLAVYDEVDGKLTFQTSKLVDDRPQLNALSIENNEIFLDAVIHGFEDPMCCPTLKSTRHFRFVDGQLDMTDYTTFTPDGRPRTITITAPASGTVTYSSVQIRGEVAIAPFENNLVYRIYDVGGVELSSGAISVAAPDLGAPGTFDTIIPIGTVLSGAVIRIEVQDISAADGSLFAMDSVELVVQ
ncbi:MAG: Gmad2 immunoglobulin-like domain-containing protein [Anaerolineae bacterium]|nr:Gmad2 immunoglobulin-like domain-containing protein [Anaerolineae bacterium]MCI0608578.1 Gmad2 immunoglobulin-like domain-containing protein [Anaerolineae bacterium]